MRKILLSIIIPLAFSAQAQTRPNNNGFTSESQPGYYLQQSVKHQITSIWIAGGSCAVSIPMICSNKKDIRIIGSCISGAGLLTGFIYQILSINMKNKAGKQLDIELDLIKSKLGLADNGTGVKLTF